MVIGVNRYTEREKIVAYSEWGNVAELVRTLKKPGAIDLPRRFLRAVACSAGTSPEAENTAMRLS
jgi:hypothetical protein